MFIFALCFPLKRLNSPPSAWFRKRETNRSLEARQNIVGDLLESSIGGKRFDLGNRILFKKIHSQKTSPTTRQKLGMS